MAKYNNIYHRKDGRWEGRVLLGRNPSTGKPQYKTFYGKTQSEVRQKNQGWSCIAGRRRTTHW